MKYKYKPASKLPTLSFSQNLQPFYFAKNECFDYTFKTTEKNKTFGAQVVKTKGLAYTHNTDLQFDFL